MATCLAWQTLSEARPNRKALRRPGVPLGGLLEGFGNGAPREMVVVWVVRPRYRIRLTVRLFAFFFLYFHSRNVMPLLYTDIFTDFPHQLRADINPYVTRLKASRDEAPLPILYGQELKDRAGQWRSYFANTMGQAPKRLILEIGVHKGQVFVDMACKDPKSGFVGMDVTMKRVVCTAEKLERHGLCNSCVLLGNASHLEALFAPEELDGIVIFFPDPWEKKEHQAKNRLLQPEFCTAMVRTLKPGGFIWFKTDAKPYFDSTCAALEGLADGERPFGDNIMSSFERRFQIAGRATYEKTFLKSLS